MISRRDLLLGALVAGCSRKAPSPSAAPAATAASLDPRTRKTKLLEWTIRSPDERVAVLLPDPLVDGETYRVVLALHGRGESLKSPAEGALGWARDYALTRSYERISSPPLVAADFEGLVEGGHLAEMNRALTTTPFHDLVIACPYVPDFDPFDAQKITEYGSYLTDVVLARVRKELPVSSARDQTGIDGVSHGGIIALLVGLGRNDAFGAVGALQPAIPSEKIGQLTALSTNAKSALPKLRLTTSHGDYFRAAIAQMDSSWTAAGIAHDFSDLPGPHDYIFNRGPGGLELLFWQDRALPWRSNPRRLDP